MHCTVCKEVALQKQFHNTAYVCTYMYSVYVHWISRVFSDPSHFFRCAKVVTSAVRLDRKCSLAKNASGWKAFRTSRIKSRDPPDVMSSKLRRARKFFFAKIPVLNERKEKSLKHLCVELTTCKWVQCCYNTRVERLLA